MAPLQVDISDGGLITDESVICIGWSSLHLWMNSEDTTWTNMFEEVGTTMQSLWKTNSFNATQLKHCNQILSFFFQKIKNFHENQNAKLADFTFSGQNLICNG